MARHKNSQGNSVSPFQHQGTPSVFTCPDCQGTLFVIGDGNLVRYRCRTGHTYSPQSMLEAQDDNVERLMWSAVRALAEQAEYLTGLSREIAGTDPEAARFYTAKKRAVEHSSDIMRRLVTRGSEDHKPAAARTPRPPSIRKTR